MTVQLDLEYTSANVLLRFLIREIRGPLLAALVLVYGIGPLWLWLAEQWPYSERLLFTVAHVLTHEATYVVCNGFFYLCDKYKLLAHYKQPRKDAQQPSAELIAKTLRETMVGHLITQPLIMYFLAWPTFQACGMPSLTAPLPNLLTAYLQLLAFSLVNSWGFYFAHRMLHLPQFYKRFHKQHHDYKGTIGIAAEYAHPLEQVLANFLPTLGGMFFTGSHFSVWLTWLIWRLETTYEDHSGYCFRGSWLDKLGLLHSDSADFHDFHHTDNRGNFGFEIQDYLFGTMDSYLKEQGRVRAAVGCGSSGNGSGNGSGSGSGNGSSNGSGSGARAAEFKAE
jgi:sterol desaturase/sphingolipid hydroxylase (fatty acid hydroxylase superfamily)